MKIKPLIISALLSLSFSLTHATESTVYVNQNIGFSVPGYKYSQKDFPCEIDKHLVKAIVKHGSHDQMKLVPVSSAEKIRNGVIPVVAMDVEQLVLTKDVQFGPKSKNPLPKVKVLAAIIRDSGMETANHTCAIATLNDFTPSSNILDLGTATTVCGAARRCVNNLGKDISEWLHQNLGK